MPDKKFLIFFIVAVILTFIVCNTPIAERWESWAFDYRLNTVGSVKNLDNGIAIIGIDEESLQRFGQWPWGRDIHAEFVDKLTKLRVKAVIYDILFDSPDARAAKGDKIFAASVKKSGRVILPFQFEKSGYLTGAKPVYPVSTLKAAAKDIGFVDYMEDIDGKVRAARLAHKEDGKIYPSLDLAALALAKNVKSDEIRYLENKIIVGDFVIPTSKEYVILINFAAPTSPLNAFKAASFGEVFDLKPGDGLYNSKICYVGATSEALKDYFTTSSGYLSGIAVHANILNTILQKKFIVKPNKMYDAVLWIALALIGLFVFPRIRAGECLFAFIGVIFIYCVINFFLFHLGYLLKLVYPLIYLFLLFAVTQAYQFAKVRKLFGQFLAEELVDKMLAEEKKQKLGGEEKEVSVLFSDIRGYTNLSEKMSPKEILGLLNEYHSRMSKVFSENKGRIFDYQGDAQMVVFGAPVETPEHAYFAVRAAVKMRDEIEKLKKDWQKDKPLEFNVGIGICTGRVAVGLVGAEEHKQYVAIGDSTNTASRLQGLSSDLGCNILVAETTYDLVKDKVKAQKFENVAVKGKAQLLTVYGILEVY